MVKRCRCSYVPPRWRTSQFNQTFISLSESLLNDIGDPIFYVGQSGFMSKAMFFLLSKTAATCFVFYCFLFLIFLSTGWLWGWSIRTDMGSTALYLPSISDHFHNNNIIKCSSTLLVDKNNIPSVNIFTNLYFIFHLPAVNLRYLDIELFQGLL